MFSWGASDDKEETKAENQKPATKSKRPATPTYDKPATTTPAAAPLAPRGPPPAPLAPRGPPTAPRARPRGHRPAKMPNLTGVKNSDARGTPATRG